MRACRVGAEAAQQQLFYNIRRMRDFGIVLAHMTAHIYKCDGAAAPAAAAAFVLFFFWGRICIMLSR